MAAVAAVILLAAAPAADAASGPLRWLRAGGCPPPYLSEKFRDYTILKQAQALKWRLPVHEQTVKLKPPIDWRQNPYDSRAFEARLADFSFLDPLLYVYDRSRDYHREGKKRALDIAFQIVLDWVRAERRGKVNTETWTDRPAARRAIFLAFVARAAACEDYLKLSTGQAGALRTSLREHAHYLRDPGIYKATNHGLSVDLALIALGRYFPRDPGMRAGGKLGAQRWKSTFLGSVEENEGVWLEHSPGYFGYAIDLAEDFLRIHQSSDPQVTELVRRMRTALAWLSDPDKFLAQFGDTNYTKAPREVRKEAGAQQGLWVAPASGYAVVKSEKPNGWLAIASSYHSGVHKHSDELSFELFDRKQRIVSDTGQYHKDRDRYFDFQRSPSAHSTLVVDGVELDSEETSPYGSGIEAWGEGDGWFAVLAKNPVVRKEQDVSHTRWFLYKPGYALVVADRVRSAPEHTYTRYFQIWPAISTAQADNRLALSGEKLDGSLTSFSTVGEARLGTVRGQENPLAGWHFPSFRKQDPRTTAAFHTSGSDADHLATFSLKGPDARSSLLGTLGDDVTILITDDRGTRTLQLHREGTAITVDEQEVSAGPYDEQSG